MDHEGVKPHAVISEIIEDLAQAEGRMRSARDKMNVPFVADAPDYASIVAHIDSALAGHTSQTRMPTALSSRPDARPGRSP